LNQPIVDLAPALVEWMRTRRESTDWVYHPRKTDVSDFVRRKFLSDLLRASTWFSEAARAGALACDLNVRLARPGGRARKLDLIVGPPVHAVGAATESDVLRKAKVVLPALSLETKLCMTEHRKATSRMIDELLSSIEVVKSVRPTCISIGIVVINVAAKFTSPLNLPGPNLHDRPHEIRRLAARIFDRVPVGAGASYDALAMALIDADNETRFEVGGGIEVPAARGYVETVRQVAALCEAGALTSQRAES
jgi:hypothetical protein